MSITDELRAWAKEHLSRSSILAIADLIDAEHQKCIDGLWEDAKYHLSDESLTEQGWVRLPKDADGEYIRIGDVMDSRVDYLFDGKPFTVRALVLCEDGWEVADGHFGNRYEPDSLRHHHAPTVEDVLREMLYKAHIYDEREMELLPDLIAEYAKRLTLAEGENV